MNQIAAIILYRHGETSPNKSDPRRKLIPKGIRNVIAGSERIKKMIDPGETEIIAFNNPRNIQTAKIISRQLKIPFWRKTPNFIISNWGPIRQIKQKNQKLLRKDLTEIYLDLYKQNRLPQKMKTPPEVASQFIKFIRSLETKAKTIILVGSGGTLEAIAYYQKKFPARKYDTMKRRILGYSEFIILSKAKALRT